MGKRIIVRRRGRGGIFEAPTHRRVAAASYPNFQEGGSLTAYVEEFIHDPGRGAPLALMRLEDGNKFYVAAPEGLSLKQRVEVGYTSTVNIGNIMPLEKIPEGTVICNVEYKPGDGGRLAKSSGAYATVVAHTPKGVEVRLPSMKTLYLNGKCRAMVGVVAGGGRVDKPFLKAGARMRLMRSRGRRWPIVKGTSMIAASHPHGGGRHRHEGKPTTTSRFAPPGRKVGLIAARHTGRGGKKRGSRE